MGNKFHKLADGRGASIDENFLNSLLPETLRGSILIFSLGRDSKAAYEFQKVVITNYRLQTTMFPCPCLFLFSGYTKALRNIFKAKDCRYYIFAYDGYLNLRQVTQMSFQVAEQGKFFVVVSYQRGESFR